MITKFRIFENNNIGDISVGDYVLLKVDTTVKDYNDFVNNNIGEVNFVKSLYNYETDTYEIGKIEVKYTVNKEDFQNLHTYFRYLDYSYSENVYSFSNVFDVLYVAYHSKNKEDILLKSNLDKYNL